MLPLLLSLTLLLWAAPDFSANMYATSRQIHARVNEAADRNSALAAARRDALDETAADDLSDPEAAANAAVAGGFKTWMRASWAREAGAPPDSPSNIQLLEVSNPHVARPATAALSLTLPESVPAAELLPLLLDSQTTAVAASRTGGPVPLRALFNFGEHGREIISSEIALRLVRMLDMAHNEGMRRAAQTAGTGTGSGGDGAATSGAPELDPLFAAFLLSHVSVSLLPLLNVWSHDRVEQGHVCERKNERGTDLNRNWDYLWGQDSRQPLLADEQYPGPSAFSEVESRVLRDLATALRPDLYVNYHSGIREMYCGWDHRAELIPNAVEVMKVLNHANDRHCHCAIGGAGVIGGYVVYGGSMDYLYDRLAAPYSLTVEVFGGSAGVSPADCYAYFNPTTPPLLEATTAEWARLTVDALYLLVREKKGVAFPFQLDQFLRAGAGAGAGAGAADRQQQQPSQQEATPNYYTRMEDLISRLDALSPAMLVRVPSALAVSPFLVYANTSASDSSSGSGSGSAPESESSSGSGSESDSVDPRPDWNNACTPFLVSLPAGVTARIERPQSLGLLVPLWREAERADTASNATTNATTTATAAAAQSEPLSVLLVGGALWNDLITTEMICAWLSAAAATTTTSDAPSNNSSSVAKIKLWLIPSLFAHARLRLLEVSALHPSFCSAALSSDAQVELLSHQLYSTQQLLRLLREVVRPRVVVEVAAEEFVPRGSASTASPSSSAEGGVSFMHVEAVSVAPESDGGGSDGQEESGAALLAHFSALMTEPTVAAAAAKTALGWGVRTRTQALLDASVVDPLQCRVGHIHLSRLLLPAPGTTAPDEANRCPSCRLFLKLYVHGSRADVPASSGQTEDGVSTLVGADVAEMAALAAAQADWTARVASDRVHPSSYRQSSNGGSSEGGSVTRKGLRSMVMAETRMEAALQSRRAASASLSPSQPPMHWCDFATRNLEAHTPQRVLALHVEQSVAVWRLLRGVLESLPASDSPLWGTPSEATATPAAFVPPTYVQVLAAEIPAHAQPPPPRDPSRRALHVGSGASAWELFGITMLIALALISLIGAAVTMCCKRRRTFSALPKPPLSPPPVKRSKSADHLDVEIEMEGV